MAMNVEMKRKRSRHPKDLIYWSYSLKLSQGDSSGEFLQGNLGGRCDGYICWLPLQRHPTRDAQKGRGPLHALRTRRVGM
jgi:hypothetical protein